MDNLLDGLLKSDVPDTVRQQFLGRIAAASQDDRQGPSVGVAILRISLSCIVNAGSSDLDVQLCRKVYAAWASNQPEFFVDFFDEAVLSTLLQTPCVRPASYGWIVCFSVDRVAYTSPPSYARLCEVVRRRLTCFLDNTEADFQLTKSLCQLLLDHPECFPEGDDLSTLAGIIIRVSGQFQVPSEQQSRARFCDELPSVIGKVLQEIFARDGRVVERTLHTVFEIVTHPNCVESMPSLGAVVQFIPDEVMRSAVYSQARDDALSDEMAYLVLTRMLDMLSWPSVRNVDVWIIAFMRGLASNCKYLALMQVAGSKVEEVRLHHISYLFTYWTVRRHTNFRLVKLRLENLRTSQQTDEEFLKLVDKLHCVG